MESHDFHLANPRSARMCTAYLPWHVLPDREIIVSSLHA